jgi:hypothetical protein
LSTHLQTRLVEAITTIGKVPRSRAKKYTRLILANTHNTRIDPFLVAALIHSESRWGSRAIKSRNYGLAQLRVSKTTNHRYLGQETKLFNPALNIKISVKMLRYWRRYHLRKCPHGHFWWSHYQWGRRVKNPRSGVRVWNTYLKYVTHVKDKQALW